MTLQSTELLGDPDVLEALALEEMEFEPLHFEDMSLLPTPLPQLPPLPIETPENYPGNSCTSGSGPSCTPGGQAPCR